MERKLIAAAVSSALVLPMAAQAVEFSVSGHINRAITSVDGGDNDGDLNHVDANSSQTRFRFTGSEELDSGMTAGVQLEYGLTGNVRHANVYLSSAGGKLTVGHASTAADGMAHADLGGVSWLGGATNWCSYHSTGPACPSNDGGRMPVLRYDTPAIGPASIAISTGGNDYWDAQLKIAGSMGDAGYDIRVGYIGETETTAAASSAVVLGSDLGKVLLKDMGAPMDLDSAENAAAAIENHMTLNPSITAITELVGDNDDADMLGQLFQKDTAAVTTPSGDVTTASAAFAFGQGTSVALAWSQDQSNDHDYQYLKLDHAYGDGSIGVVYKRGEKGATEGSLVGIGIGHSLGGGATAYAGYRQMSEDGKDDVDLVVVGMRVTFN